MLSHYHSISFSFSKFTIVIELWSDFQGPFLISIKSLLTDLHQNHFGVIQQQSIIKADALLIMQLASLT